MSALRILAAFSLLGALVAPAMAQSPYPPGPPPAVPALPDSARQTTYTISGTTCACSVGFDLYQTGTDFDAAIEVFVNGAPKLSTDPTFGWSLSTSAPGGFAVAPRPVTDAVLTFNNAQTGTVIIVGAERPRRLTEFSEGGGVTARQHNQAYNTLFAIGREVWDKTNDLTGRTLLTQPGNTMKPLPLPGSCAGSYLGLGSDGLTPTCLPGGPGAIAGTLTINPASGTAAQGLVVNQTLPTGTVNTTYNANQFTVTNPGYYSTAAGLDSYGVIAGNDSGVRVNYTASGGVPTSIHIGFLSTAAEGSGSRPYQVIGLDGAAYSNVGTGTGASTGDTIWGVIGYGNVGPSGKVYSSIAIEAESAVATGGQLSNRIAFSASSDGVGIGSAVDTAFLVSLGGAPDPTYGTPNPFTNLITIGVGSSHSGSGAGAGISSTGSIITSDGDGTFTTGCFACLPAATFSNFYMNFANWVVGPNGTSTFGSGASGGAFPTLPIVLNARVASGGQAQLISNTNSANAADGFQALDSGGTVALFTGVGEAANGGSTFGVSNNNSGRVIANNVSALLFGTFSNAGIIIGTNNVERARIFGDGCFDVGTTGDCGGPGILNLGTGLRIANAASSGHVLRGNGTNYVDSALAATDLSDYAASTWTPAITTDGTAGTPAYTTQVGSYEKIGRHVVVRFNIVLSGWSGSPTGNVKISGLPFASANTASDFGRCAIDGFSTSTSFASISGFVNINDTTAGIRAVAAAGATAPTNMTAAQAGATLALGGRCEYHT